MPFPNEHAARLKDPSQYAKVRRNNNKFGDGIDAIFGVKSDGTTELQAIRFRKSKFTADRARSWLKEHDHKAIEFEAASHEDSIDQEDIDQLRVARFDVSKVGTASRTPEGYVKADAAISRIGVFRYHNPDGSIRNELRHPDDVFKADSLDTLKMKPVTDGHPSTRLINSKTARRFQVGSVGENVRADGKFLMATMMVTDSDAVLNVESGKKKGLSCGYTCDLVKEDGVYNGERFDCRQTNIRYNHLALCEFGRAGEHARINLDSLDGDDAYCEDTIEFHIDDNTNPNRSKPMIKVRCDNGLEYDAAPEVGKYLETLKSNLDSANALLKSKTDEFDKLKGEHDSLKEEKTKVDEQLKDRSKIDEAVKSRLSLERTASPHLDEETVKKISEMDEMEIKKAVILKAFPKADEQLKDASEAYVNARYDSALDVLDEGMKMGKKGKKKEDEEMMSSQRRKVFGDKTKRDSEDESDPETARNDMMDRACNAWKEGLPEYAEKK